ncbi:hypothetical protein IWZ00DRAFT_86355 [Phyllosticta capitalensis]
MQTTSNLSAHTHTSFAHAEPLQNFSSTTPGTGTSSHCRHSRPRTCDIDEKPATKPKRKFGFYSKAFNRLQNLWDDDCIEECLEGCDSLLNDHHLPRYHRARVLILKALSIEPWEERDALRREAELWAGLARLAAMDTPATWKNLEQLQDAMNDLEEFQKDTEHERWEDQSEESERSDTDHEAETAPQPRRPFGNMDDDLNTLQLDSINRRYSRALNKLLRLWDDDELDRVLEKCDQLLQDQDENLPKYYRIRFLVIKASSTYRWEECESLHQQASKELHLYEAWCDGAPEQRRILKDLHKYLDNLQKSTDAIKAWEEQLDNTERSQASIDETSLNGSAKSEKQKRSTSPKTDLHEQAGRETSPGSTGSKRKRLADSKSSSGPACTKTRPRAASFATSLWENPSSRPTSATPDALQETASLTTADNDKTPSGPDGLLGKAELPCRGFSKASSPQVNVEPESIPASMSPEDLVKPPLRPASPLALVNTSSPPVNQPARPNTANTVKPSLRSIGTSTISLESRVSLEKPTLAGQVTTTSTTTAHEQEQQKSSASTGSPSRTSDAPTATLERMPPFSAPTQASEAQSISLARSPRNFRSFREVARGTGKKVTSARRFMIELFSPPSSTQPDAHAPHGEEQTSRKTLLRRFTKRE